MPCVKKNRMEVSGTLCHRCFLLVDSITDHSPGRCQVCCRMEDYLETMTFREACAELYKDYAHAECILCYNMTLHVRKFSEFYQSCFRLGTLCTHCRYWIFRVLYDSNENNFSKVAPKDKPMGCLLLNFKDEFPPNAFYTM